MDGHHRHLDDKANQQQQECPHLEAHAPHLRGGKWRIRHLTDLSQSQEIECVQRRLCGMDCRQRACASCPFEGRAYDVCGQQLFIGKRSKIAGKVKHQNCQQHEHTAQQGIEEKLNRSVFAARPTPDTNQEIHRQQHHFPKHIEEKKVERHKYAQHACF